MTDAERLWCKACGTVTRDMHCDCNRWPDGHEMRREPNFVNYADSMQETACEQAQEIERLREILEEIATFTSDPVAEQAAREALSPAERTKP